MWETNTVNYIFVCAAVCHSTIYELYFLGKQVIVQWTTLLSGLEPMLSKLSSCTFIHPSKS